MASPKTLAAREADIGQSFTFIHRHPAPKKMGAFPNEWYLKPRGMVPFQGSEKDRRFNGKDRIRHRRYVKALTRLLARVED